MTVHIASGTQLRPRLAAAAAVGVLHVLALAVLVAVRAPAREPFQQRPVRVVLLPESVTPVAALVPMQPDPAPTPRLDLPMPVLADESPVDTMLLPIDRQPLAVAAAAVGPASTVAMPMPAIPEIDAIEYLVPPAPRYPASSRRLREQGTVMLRVLVGADGRAVAAQVLASSGSQRLDEAARRAVLEAVFRPYVRGGVPAAAYVRVPIEFALRS